MVKGFYAMQQTDNARDVMDVAAVRDARLLQALCAQAEHEAAINVGVVWAAAGLGEAPVARMALLSEAVASPSATRRKFGSLLTFVSEGWVRDSARLQLRRLLAVHLRCEAQLAALRNVTALAGGVRDFTPLFGQWCFATQARCHLEYIVAHAGLTNVHEMALCSALHQLEAVR